MKNKNLIIIIITIIILIIVGFVGYRYYFQYQTSIQKPSDQIQQIDDKEKVDKKTVVKETKFFQEYTDELGVKWRIFGKYEVAKINNEIVVRNKENLQEISQIPKSIYTEFATTIPLPFKGRGEVERKEGSINYIALNNELNKLYIFVKIPEYRGATGNESWNIIESDLNGKNISVLPRATLGRIMLKETFLFSSGGKFFSYLSYSKSGSAGCSFSRFIEIYDLSTKKAYKIKPPKDSKEYIQQYNISKPEESFIINSFIDSYQWINEDAIELTFYFSRCFDKISPEETWQYDLTTQEYTFIKSE